ncbi:MAG: LamG domain-containing protein [Bacteroidetes bacterium]|nr:LamG domain-containing protein [Bacteroidota bacterium]
MLTAIATGLGTGSACQLSELPSSLRQGLLAWYPFCGNATDQSGNGNDGTVYGASLTSDRFGQPGNAYSFNGSNNYIEVLNSANWQFADSKQSISFWIYLPVIPNPIGNDMAILSKTNQNLPIDPSGNSNTGFEVIFGQNIYSPDLDYRFKSGAGSSWLVTRIAQSNFTINQWFHVVFVTDKQKDSCYAYLNGNLINRQLIPTSTVIGQNNLPLLMGKGYWTSNGIPSNYYNGKLDDVGIWNRAISPEEVKQLYSGLTYLWSTGDSGQVITVSPTQTTTYVVTASNGINNCTASVTVTVNEATSSLTDISTCDAYTWNGQIYTQPGVYTYHTTNVAGCDSIATLNLTFNLPSMVASSAGASADNIAPGTPVTLNVNGVLLELVLPGNGIQLHAEEHQLVPVHR